MAHWLRCKVLPGQFSNEYVVEGQSITGEGFSLFCPEEFVECESEPSFQNPADGWIQVEIVQSEKGVLLIRLPKHTLENGPYATVSQDAVERRRVRQKV